MDEAGKLCMDIAHLINKEGGQSESSGEPI